MSLSLFDLVDLHLEVLYERDLAGRLIGTRRTERVPSYHLMRTVKGNRVVLSVVLSDRERRRLEAGLRREPVVGDLQGMERQSPQLGAPAQYRGPAFQFPDRLPAGAGGAELLGDVRGVRTVPELSWVREVTQAELPVTVAQRRW